MRHSEFWERIDTHLGRAYGRVWVDTQVLPQLDGRTPREALDAGVLPKQVWRAVHSALELPAADR
jgi:hypothetical protein